MGLSVDDDWVCFLGGGYSGHHPVHGPTRVLSAHAAAALGRILKQVLPRARLQVRALRVRAFIVTRVIKQINLNAIAQTSL